MELFLKLSNNCFTGLVIRFRVYKGVLYLMIEEIYKILLEKVSIFWNKEYLLIMTWKVEGYYFFISSISLDNLFLFYFCSLFLFALWCFSWDERIRSTDWSDSSIFNLLVFYSKCWKPREPSICWLINKSNILYLATKLI